MKRMVSLFVKVVSLVLALFITVLFLAIGYYSYTLPNNYYINENDKLELNLQGLSVDSSEQSMQTSYPNGNLDYDVNILGIFPVKTVVAKQVDDIYLNAYGTQFGVKMFSAGAIVVGLQPIPTEKGSVSPWKDRNIKEGDIIVSANNKTVQRNSELALIIEESKGKDILLQINRDDKIIKTTITPALCKTDGNYKTGVLVRDSTAGIGTITYVDPQNSTFAGLGHGICDVDTGKIIPVGSGEVCDVVINNISKGKSGEAGELMGIFTSDEAFGSIELNNQTGIYGEIFDSEFEGIGYLLAHKQDVHEGDATIICGFDGENTQEYEIQIQDINYDQNAQVKNLVIKVTDERLINLTGGIVQGMSGTPIIQDDKLVGAVTHVFINDAKKGYGIFAENMYDYSSQLNLLKK